MKNRSGFVSNSSSSSFIVMKPGPINNQILPAKLVIGELGECEFGWEFGVHDNFYSKLNFAWLQAQQNEKWMVMLYCVLCKHGAEQIESILSDDWDVPGKRHAYIDHQSSAVEGENTEIFDDEETLEMFLFCPNCYIQCDNDNY